MYKNTFSIKAILVSSSLCLIGLSGCATPDYVNHAPTSVVESVQMTQSDTAMKLSKICNNTVASSGVLEQQMAKYLNSVAKSDVNDKTSILKNLTLNLQSIKQSLEEISSFNPASALKQRTADIKLELNNVDSYLRSLKRAVEDDNINGMSESFDNYMHSIGALKTLSTGM